MYLVAFTSAYYYILWDECRLSEFSTIAASMLAAQLAIAQNVMPQ